MTKRLLIALAWFGAVGCSAPRALPATKPSVLLITIDTLRADRVGAYGDASARTPSIDALAASGVLFERAYSPVPITLPAHVSLMTGLIPPAHGVRGNGGFQLGPGTVTLAEVMKASGRSTAAFIGGFPLSRRFGLGRGFDHYDDEMTKAPGVNYDFAERRGRDVVGAAARWLNANPGPVFVWVHLFDPHAPYDPPLEFRATDPYRDEIAAADAAVGELMRVWDARPGKSVVALTADHGEAFGEHDEWSHSLFIYDTTLHVPLIVRGGSLAGGARVNAVVGLVDVATTLAQLAGEPPTRLPGAMLTNAPSQPDRALYAETLAPRQDFGWSELRSWRSDGRKWIRAPQSELYSVVEDPAEEHNRVANESEAASKLESDLANAIAKSGEHSAARAADQETMERLGSLGYVQTPGGKGSGADPKTKAALAHRIANATGPFKDWNDAIGVYRSLLKDDPPNPLLNLRLADALLRSGKTEASIVHFRRVIAGGPSSVDAHVGCATALAQLGRLTEARKILESALITDSKSGQVHYNLGEIARVEGRTADARREYEAAIHDPVTAARARARLSDVR